MRRLDLIGQKFGRLTVFEFAYAKYGSSYWKCLCDCGNESIVNSNSLKRGATKSCGCYAKEQVSDKEKIDLTNRKFGRLTAIRSIKKGKWNYWECECECGQNKMVRIDHLMSGKIKSCGCYGSEVRSISNKTHGKSGSRAYTIWQGMKNRCYRKNNAKYETYGARGIKICPEWKNSFEKFYEDMGDPPEGMSIDRINDDGNYEPSNCHWATPKIQANNTRHNHMIFYKGEEKTLMQWCDELKLKYDRVKLRLNRYHWSVEDAFTKPPEGPGGGKYNLKRKTS